MATRVQSAAAGVAGVALTLGLSELIAAVVEGVPSVINSVGSLLVPVTPPGLKDFAVTTFGTSDKAVLAGGTVIISLILGAVIGNRTKSQTGQVFAIFAILGIYAQLSLPLTIFPIALVTTGGVAAAGWAALHWIRDRADDQEAERAARRNDDVVIERRQFVFGLGGIAVAAVAATALAKQLTPSITEASADIGALPTPSVGTADLPAGSAFDIPGISPIVTANEDFYLIDTALSVPRINVDTWELRIHGMVDQEVTLTFDDLMSMDLVEKHVTMLCVSNEVGGDLIGTAKWLGVPLKDVLDMAGVKNGATQIVGRSIDGWTGGFPTEAAFDGRDAMIAIAMNDAPLPPAHGFPARLIIPGLYGYVSATKWITEIELTTWEGFDGFWVPRGWSKEGPVKTQSRIDVPRNGTTFETGTGTVVAGVAWAPTRAVSKVEVRVDGGEWQDTELSQPINDDVWVQWRAELDLSSGEHGIEVRATDGEGDTQTETPAPPRPDGAQGYHRIGVRVG